jgi:hypothetical protein
MTSNSNVTVTITPQTVKTCTTYDPTTVPGAGPWLPSGYSTTSMDYYYPAYMGGAIPSDSTTENAGWTVNITWAYRSNDPNGDLLCGTMTPDLYNDNWGNPINGTVLLVRRGNCAFGIKAQNAAQLGAIGVIIMPINAQDPPGILIGSQDVKIPVSLYFRHHRVLLHS